jgi:hypothetical protein
MMRPDEPLAPSVVVRAAVDVLVFAPLGLGAKLVEDTPATIKTARRELSNARFIGRLVVDRGIKQVRSRLEPAPLSATRPISSEGLSDELAPPMPVVDIVGSDELMASGLLPSDLALPDYDTLPAIDIVAKLDTLEAADREAIERYEVANRQRRTVLGKLAQLADQ